MQLIPQTSHRAILTASKLVHTLSNKMRPKLLLGVVARSSCPGFLNASCHLVVLSLHHQEQAVCGLQDEAGRLGSVPYYNRRPANAASFIALVIHCTEVYLGRCLQTWVLIQILHPTQGITLGFTLYFYVIER